MTKPNSRQPAVSHLTIQPSNRRHRQHAQSLSRHPSFSPQRLSTFRPSRNGKTGKISAATFHVLILQKNGLHCLPLKYYTTRATTGPSLKNIILPVTQKQFCGPSSCFLQALYMHAWARIFSKRKQSRKRLSIIHRVRAHEWCP